jgi:WD40 repeat protein
VHILELGNPDSGAFRVRLLRRGEPYGPHHELVYDRDAPVLEFYGPALAGEQPGEAKLLGTYAASQFLHPRQGWTRVGDGYGVSPANARDIAAWLERELSNPWTPPSGPKPQAQVITDRPVRLHQAGERRATIYVRGDEGYRKEEAEWVEVSRRRDGQYVIGYLPRPGQRDAYGRRRRTGHQALEMVFHSRPPIIIFLGWDHPDLQTQMPPEEHSFQSGQQTQRYTVIKGMSIESREYRERPENVAKRLGLQQMFDSELDRYLATYPLTHILLDLREPSPERTEPAALSDQLVLDASGVKDVDAEVAQAASQAPSVFVSYHHGGDAAARDRFERENGSIIRSSSIYPGEISSGPEVRREIRKRIVGCHYVVVLVGRETYTRRWVDWEIHAALTRDRGGAPRPVVGILLPEMSTLGALLQSLLVKPSPRTTVGELLQLSDELSRELVAETGATLPARLLDNLLTGYAILVPWPASQTALLDALASSVGRARPVNGRRLLRQNLPMSPSSPPVPGPVPEPAEVPQRELVTAAGPGDFPAGDRSAWLVSALQSYGPEEVLAALGAKGDAESAKLAAALRRHAHVLAPLDSETSMAATLVTRLVAGDALSAMRTGLTALIRGHHLAATAQLPDVTPGTLNRILAQLANPFRGQRIVADPNGGWIATGSEGLIEVWKAFEGRRLHRFEGMWGEVEDLIVDRNGNWLAATDDINFVRVWSIPSGELLLERFAGQYGTGVLAADPAGRWLAGGGARDVSIWDIGSRERLHKLDTGGIRPRVLIFGPQGQWLCCINDGLRKIRIWPMPAGEPTRDLIDRTKDFWIQYLAVDPAGRWLATAGRGAVRVWDIDTGERLHALVPPGGSLEAFEVGPQAQWLYCAGSSGAVRLSPTPAGQPAAKPANRSKAKNKWAELFVGAAGRELMSSDQAGRWVTRQHISIWDPAAPPPPSRYFPQFLGPVTALTADTAGSWYSYAIEGDDGIRVHDVTTGTERKMTAASSGSPGQGAGAALQADPHGTWLASAVDDGIVRIWDPRNGTERFKLPGRVRQAAADVAIRFATEAGGRWLACSGDSPEIVIWSPVTGQRLNTLSVPDGSVRAMIADPSGTWVASGGLDGPIRLWRPDGSLPYQVLSGHDGAVQALAAGPLGHLLVSAGEDATIRLWDPAGDANPVFTVPVPASQLTMSPNGNWFASASGDATIRIWNSRENTQHHIVVESHTEVTAISPDPAGRYLASIAADSTVSIWEPVTGRVIASLRVGGTPTRILWTSGHLVIGSDQGAYLLELHG